MDDKIDVAYLDLMTIRGGPVQDFFIGKRWAFMI